MTVSWLPLPYDAGALAPHLSRASVTMHHAHHQRVLIDELCAMVKGTPYATLGLEGIITQSAVRREHRRLFDAAAEAWNHDFYFRSMKPGGGGLPTQRLGALLERRFGGIDEFKQIFLATTMDVVGSGWVWLIFERGSLTVRATANCDTPIARGETPLLGLDLWEHAYHLDHQSRRSDYVKAFLAYLANWQFASANLDRALDAEAAHRASCA